MSMPVFEVIPVGIPLPWPIDIPPKRMGEM